MPNTLLSPEEEAELKQLNEIEALELAKLNAAEQSSVGGAAGRGLASSILPAIAGVAAASKPAITPVLNFLRARNPYVGLGVRALAGAGAGFGGMALQQKAIEELSPELAARLQADRLAHPVATDIGGAASALVGGFAGLPKDAVSGGLNLLRRTALPQAQKLALAGLGIQPVIQGGIDVGAQLAQTGDVDVSGVLRRMALSLPFNKPYGELMGNVAAGAQPIKSFALPSSGEVVQQPRAPTVQDIIDASLSITQPASSKMIKDPRSGMIIGSKTSYKPSPEAAAEKRAPAMRDALAAEQAQKDIAFAKKQAELDARLNALEKRAAQAEPPIIKVPAETTPQTQREVLPVKSIEFTEANPELQTVAEKQGIVTRQPKSGVIDRRAEALAAEEAAAAEQPYRTIVRKTPAPPPQRETVGIGEPVFTEQSELVVPEARPVDTADVAKLPAHYAEQQPGKITVKGAEQGKGGRIIHDELIRQGFTESEIANMSEATALEIYNNAVRAPDISNPNPRLKAQKTGNIGFKARYQKPRTATPEEAAQQDTNEALNTADLYNRRAIAPPRSDPNLTDETGRPVSGEMLPRTSPDEPAIVTVNPRYAQKDVLPHEAMHSHIYDMLNGGNAADRAKAQKAIETAQRELPPNTPESDILAAAEELLVAPGGSHIRDITRSPNTQWRGVKELGRDINAAWNPVKNAGREARYLANRTFYDAPYSETYGKGSVNAPRGGSRYQPPMEDDTPSQSQSRPDDAAEYNRLSTRFKELTAAKDFGQEFMDTWQQIETIKNRHGGMPPSEARYQPPAKKGGELNDTTETQIQEEGQEVSPWDKIRDTITSTPAAPKPTRPIPPTDLQAGREANMRSANRARFQEAEYTGADVERGLEIISGNMYDKPVDKTVAKETVQNALDAIDKGGTKQIDIAASPWKKKGGIFYIRDYGIGMLPDEVVSTFLKGFTSGKTGDTSRGSFGLAKATLLTAPEELRVRTVKDGIKTTVEAKSGQWMKFAQAGKFGFDPTKFGKQVLPGGIEVTIERASSEEPTGTTYWSKMPKTKPDGSDIQADADDAKDAAVGALTKIRDPDLKIRYAPIDEAEDSFFDPPDAAFLERRTEAAKNPVLSTPQRTYSVPGAEIEVYYDNTKPLTKLYGINVTNRGQAQFEQSLYSIDAKLPEGLSIEVKPTVPVTDGNYPYTLNRDALKGPAKTQVEQIISRLADEAKSIEIDLYTKFKNNAPRIAGTHSRFVDLSQSLPKEISDSIINSPVYATLGRVLKKHYEELINSVAKKGAVLDRMSGSDITGAKFAGFAFGGQNYGVRVGSRIPGSPGEIYHDLVVTARNVDAVMMNHPEWYPEGPAQAYADAITGVMPHELSHQISHSEGEEHARVMTGFVGMMAREMHLANKAIVRALNDHPNFHQHLADIADAATPYENTQNAKTILDVASKQKSREQEISILSSEPRGNKPTSPEQINEGAGKSGARYQQPTRSEQVDFSLPDEQGAKPNASPGIVSQLQRATGLQPVYDAAIRTEGKKGEIVVAAHNAFKAQERQIYGKYFNGPVGKLNPLSVADREKLYKVLIAESHDGASYKHELPPALHDAYNELRDAISAMGVERASQPVKLPDGQVRNFEQKPLYFPNVIKRAALEEIARDSNSPLAERLKQDFLNHAQLRYEAKGMSSDAAEAKANEILGNLIEAITTTKPGATEIDPFFGGVYESEGVGLPPSWIEPNIIQAWKRYVTRYGAARAYYDKVESNPDVMNVLGRKQDYYGRPIPPNPDITPASDENIKFLVRDMEGALSESSAANEASNVLHAALTPGITTGVQDVLTNAKQLALAPVSAWPPMLKSYAEALSDLAISAVKRTPVGKVATTYQTGFAQRHRTLVEDSSTAISSMSDKLRRAANAIRTATGRALSETVARTIAQAGAEPMGAVMRNAARNGDIQAKAFFEKLVPEGGWDSMPINELGTRIAQITQGRYDASELPKWVLDGPLAPFAKLPRWTIGQGNNFIKYYGRPIAENPTNPVLYAKALGAIFSGIIPGLIYNEYRKLLTGKKGPTASEKEIDVAKFNATDERIYKLALAADMAGTLGLPGNALAAALNIAHGREGSTLSYPLMDAVGDIIKNTVKAVDAYADGSADGMDIITEWIGNTSRSMVPAYNALHGVYAQAAPKSKAGIDLKIANQQRDVDIYNRTQLDRGRAASGLEPSYENLTERRYKRGSDVSPEAADKVIDTTIRKSKSVEQLQQRWQALNNMSLHSIPGFGSVDTMPQAIDFLDWVSKTQGPRAARSLVVDYVKRSSDNAVKKDLLKEALARRIARP